MYMCFCCFAVLLTAAVKSVKLLILHVLELFVNYMTILTASMEASVEIYRSMILYSHTTSRIIENVCM